MNHPTIERLATDSEYRTELVETMRSAAVMLTSVEPGQYSEATKVRVAHIYAQRLLEAAAGLCEHVRVEDLRCRYCGAIVVRSEDE